MIAESMNWPEAFTVVGCFALAVGFFVWAAR